MVKEIEAALSTFDENILAVQKLMNFDREILDIAIHGISDLRERLRTHHKLDNPHLSAENLLKVLERVRENDSLRGRYQTIFNQALVLLVSYFGSATGQLFKHSMMHSLRHEENSALLNEDLKISLREIKDADFSLNESIADMFVEKQDISFQDMQSIGRTFGRYLNVNVPPKDKSVNDIILGQAARHVIVHSGGVIDDRLLRQVAKASPRDIKEKLQLGDRLQFSPEEVEKIAGSMRTYVQVLGKTLAEKIETTPNSPAHDLS